MRGPLPTITEWKKDLAYCSTQSDHYNALMPVRCAPKYIWGPYRQYLLDIEEAPDSQEELDRSGVG